MSLSENLKRLLSQHSISVAELARKTNVPQPVMHRLVNGDTPNPTVFTLKPIAKYFSVSINQLIDDASLTYMHTHLKKETIHPVHGNASLKIPLIDWKKLIKWKLLIKKKFKKYISIDEDIYKKEIFALDMNNYRHDIYDSRFSNHTVIIVDPLINPLDKDYLVIFKKSSLYPYISQYIKDKNKCYLKNLDQTFAIRELSKNEKIVGVIIQTTTRYRLTPA